MPYPGYLNASYVPSDTERLFIAHPEAHLGPNLLSLSFANLFQGIVLVQATIYGARWWSNDTLSTRAHVVSALLLSLVHTALLMAQEWAVFVPGFGDWEALTHTSAIARSATLSATLLSLCAQLFFVIRVYKLQWRFDYIFIPLVIFLFGSLGTGVGRVVMTPAQLTGTALPDIFHRLDIGSAIFPLLLSVGITVFMLAFLVHKALPASAPVPCILMAFALHSALPATLLAALDLASAFAEPPYAFRELTHSLVGYLQAICMLYALNSRTHPSELEAQAQTEARGTAADLRWTARVPLVGTAPRLSLLPMHRRVGSSLTAASEPLKRTNTDKARARRVSEADSGYSISFGPPGLHYDASTFRAIYEEERGEDV